jgi:hypothetical protein
MKYFLIKYHFTTGSKDEWHRDVARFITALDSDPVLAGKISYRAMKTEADDYFHLAAVVDQEAVKTLGSREFFERYTEMTEQVGGGHVDVVPLEMIAETAFKA